MRRGVSAMWLTRQRKRPGNVVKHAKRGASNLSDTDTQNDKKMRDASIQATPEESPYVLGMTIERAWHVLPGRILRFPVRMYLSGEMLAKRERTIGLIGDERKTFLIDFRTRVLSDVLEREPEGFPDFPAHVDVTPPGGSTVNSTKLSDRAYHFFNRRDKDGRLIFALLVQDVMQEYWDKAVPDPIKPASVSTPGERDTSTRD